MGVRESRAASEGGARRSKVREAAGEAGSSSSAPAQTGDLVKVSLIEMREAVHAQ